MRPELTFISEKITTALTAYKASNDTGLLNVAMFDTNSSVKKYQDYLEENQIVIVYRELPGMYPNMPVSDKIISANFFVYALEKEKEHIKAILDDFTDTYNSTLQSMNEGAYKVKFQFTNLTPIGRADNKGALIYQAWQFGATMTVIDSITSIFDRSISISGNTINALNGLIKARLEKVPVYALYGKEALTSEKVLRYIDFRITFTVLDSSDSAISFLKSKIYDGATSMQVIYTSGTSSVAVTGRIVSASDEIDENGYPILVFVIERG